MSVGIAKVRFTELNVPIPGFDCVLSDLQDSRTAGSLLLGPDGEIIQLSLFENGQGQPQGDSDIQEQGKLSLLRCEMSRLGLIINNTLVWTLSSAGFDNRRREVTLDHCPAA